VAPIPVGTPGNPNGNTATTHAIGYDTALAGYNAYGPHSELNRGNISYTVEYDKQFNDVWSLRTAANNYRERRWDFNQNTGWTAITLPAGGVGPFVDKRGVLPSKGLIQEDGGGVQMDLLAHYFALHHAVENSSLLTIDFNDYYRYDPTYNTGPDAALAAWGAGGANVPLVPATVRGQQNLIPAGPITYFPEGYNNTGSSTSLLTRRRTTSVGGNFRQQMTFFKGRLITFAGVRYDAVRFNQRDYTVQFPDVGYNGLGQTGPGVPGITPGIVNGTGQVRRYFHETKPNLGFNVKVMKNIHLYGSYSESYFVDQTSRPAVIAGWTDIKATKASKGPPAVPAVAEHFISSPFKPETATGWDYGVKVSFFDERLNATLGGFYANRKNVAVSDVVQDPATGGFTTVTIPGGDQVDKGAEFDLNWLPTDNLSITASAAVVNAKYKNFGTGNPEAKGRSVAFVSPENGSISSKYTFSTGPAKGLDLEASVTYVSSTPSEQPNAGDTVNPTTLVTTGHTDQWMLRTPSSIIWTFGLHYVLPWKWHNTQQTLGFTVKNAFNEYYLKDGSNATLTNNMGDSRAFIVTYEIAHF